MLNKDKSRIVIGTKQEKPTYQKYLWKDHMQKKISTGNNTLLAQSQVGSKIMNLDGKKNGRREREPMKWWGCGEPHLLRDCAHNTRSMYNIQIVQEATTVKEIS